MYQQRYAEVAADSPKDARRNEYQALDRVIFMLEKAQKTGAKSQDLFIALDKLEAIWSIFMEDLVNVENELPEELRARLVSIGLWNMQHSLALRLSNGGDLSTLIEINSMVRDGLR